jgi:DNA uptake protein ComE-like DNA-binding protein
MKTKWMRELLCFSRKERNGIVILLSIIFLLIITTKLIPLFIQEDSTDFSKWEAEVKLYLDKNEERKSIGVTLHPEAFDPNEVDSIGLVNMGLPVTVISNWMRYLEKGGRFRAKDGVKKIYGMTPGLFEQLDSFIIIPTKNYGSVNRTSNNSGLKPVTVLNRDTFSRHSPQRDPKPLLRLIELNSADSLQLIEVRGIGAILASRIIRYRNLLGGFYAVSQLKEVYGMREENFAVVAPLLAVDPSLVKPFNINFSTVKELGRHPYIGYRSAGMVVKLRDKTGKFTSPDNLSSIISVDSLARLVPYLKFAQ